MDSQPFRDRMVDRLLLTLAVRSVAVESAIRSMPYHEHIPEIWTRADRCFERMSWDPRMPNSNGLEQIYSGEPIVTRVLDHHVADWFPAVAFVTHMLERLDVREGARIGVIARPAHQCFIQDLLSRIAGSPGSVTVFSSSEAIASTREYFDRILVFGGCDRVTRQMVRSLSVDGHLIVPVHHGGWFQLLRVRADGTANLVGSAGTNLPTLPECASPPKRIMLPSDISPQEAPIPLELTFEVTLRDFLYFLAFSHPAACLLYSPETRTANVGVYISRDTWATHRSKTHYFVGTPKALEILGSLANRFVEIGCPTIGQYDLIFDPSDEQSGDVDEKVRICV